MANWINYKGEGPWTFVEQAEKSTYNEGDEISTADNPVWNLTSFGVPVSPSHHPSCGYWTKEYIPKVPTPPVTTELTYAIAGQLIAAEEDLCVAYLIGDEVQWIKRYYVNAGNHNSIAYTMTDNDDGIVVAGSMADLSGDVVHTVLKLSKTDGSIMWSILMDSGNANETVTTIIEAHDGSLIYTGRLFRGGVIVPVVVNITSAGAVSWVKTLTSGTGVASAIAKTSDGGYVATVNSTDLAALSTEDIILIKINSSGTIVWSKQLTETGEANIEFATSVQQTSDNGFIIAGRGGTGSISNGELLIIKTDSAGVVSWSIRLPSVSGVGDREGNYVREVSDGFVFTGYHVDNINLTKVDSSGSLVWSKKLDSAAGGAFGDVYYGDDGYMTTTSNGIIYVGGGFVDFGETDVTIAYVNSDGEISDCASISDETPTINAAGIGDSSLSLSTTSYTLTPVAHTMLTADADTVVNTYCENGVYFARQIIVNDPIEWFSVYNLTVIGE